MNITDFSLANAKDAVSTLGFTKDQNKAYDELIKFISEPYNPNDYKHALSGPAGTGKTYLLKAIIKNCKYTYSSIGLSAPTHKACRVMKESINISGINVRSMASYLGFRPNYDAAKFDIKNPPFDSKGRIKILDEKPQLLIMDESSMIGRGELFYIEKFCKQVQCKIIFVGDESQLPPIGERYAPAFRNIPIHKLTQIVRQGDDNPVSPLLEILRYDITHKTSEFINRITKVPSSFNEDYTKGYQVLNPNAFTETVYRNFNDPEYSKNIEFAKIIAYTNDWVSSWNKYVRNAIIKDADKSILTKHDLVLSGTTIVDQFRDTIIVNSEEYIINDIVNYTHPKYNIKGFMVKFQAIHGGRIARPLFVLDHNDMFSVQMYYKISNDLIEIAKNASVKLRAQSWKNYYDFKDNCLIIVDVKNSLGQTLINRNIDYGFAITSHKAQGSTYDTALVDVNDIVYDKYGYPRPDVEFVNRLLYVACSRCKNKLYLKYGK